MTLDLDDTPLVSGDHCGACWALGIVATLNGPTCTHHIHGANAAWFPENWEKLPEYERLAIITARQNAILNLED